MICAKYTGEQLNMAFDPRAFSPMLATDTCSIWNILSSKKIFNATNIAKITFYVTPMVLYECLIKPRKNISNEKLELIRRLKSAKRMNYFSEKNCQLETLIYIHSIAPKKLNSGELSSIALAYDLSNDA